MTSGLGLLVIKAAQMAAKGEHADTVIQEVEEYRNNVVTNFLLPSIDMIEKVKKQSLLTKAFVKALNFIPALVIKNGDIKVQRFFLGYLNNLIIQYIRYNFANKKTIDTKGLFLIHTGYNEEERQLILKEIEKYIQFDEVILQKASATLSANCGIQALGFAYIKNNND